MGQVISFIFGRCFGGNQSRVDDRKLIQNYEDCSPSPPSYYVHIAEEHISNNDATVEKLQEQNFNDEALENDVSFVTNIPQQKRQQVSDPLAEVDFQLPLIATDSTDHVEEIHEVEETTKLIQNYGDFSPPPLSYYIDVAFFEQYIKHNLNNEAIVEKEEQNFNDEAAPENDISSVTVTDISQQEQKEVSDPLAEVDFQQPLITTDSTDYLVETHVVEETTKLIQNYCSPPPLSYCIDIVEEHKLQNLNNEATVEKEEQNFNDEAATENDISSVAVTNISQQKQQEVSDPLAEVDFQQPLIATDSTDYVVETHVVEETTKLIQNYEDCSPPLSYYIDIVEEHKLHNLNNEATVEKEEQNFSDEAEPENDISSGVTVTNISQQKQQVSDPLEEFNFQQPLISADFAGTVGDRGNTDHVLEIHVVEETKKQIIQAEKSTSSNWKKKEIINKKIGEYESRQKILLVGEGDFSFSASLAVAFGDASNIVATSLNEKGFLMKNYKKAMANIKELENRGAFVIHGMDATTMANHELLSRIRFDRIIFNFPHSGAFGSSESDLSQNQTLVGGFLRNAKRMIVEDGEIHVTHKTRPFFMKWNIVQLALMEGLSLVEEAPFHHTVYPGYCTKYGFGGNRYFYCYPCSIYKFELLL